jgi:hypothetical protein
MCAYAKTDTELAMREKLRSETVAPMCTNSRTDSEKTDPKRAKPSIAREDPKRLILRSDTEAPRCRKSRTESAAPKRAKLLSASDAPN